VLPWRQPLGASPRGDGTVEFRVWALKPERVAVRVRGADHPMTDAGHGVREAVVEAAPGDDYWFVLDGEPLPDPASRSQPEGLRGPSRVVAVEPPRALAAPPALADLVLYELHVGTFSPEGTFDGAIAHLDALAELGATGGATTAST
jgi:maltooligosyltrehalose trehalohydrolase